jgi:hypothetical protein
MRFAYAVPLLLVAVPAAAQSVFDGTWKADTSSAQFGGKPQDRTLKNGSYTCSTCTPPYTVKADGRFQPVRGNPYLDETSVTVVDPSTVKFAYRRAGKSTGEDTVTISPDGKTATWKGVDRSAVNGTPVEYDVQDTRVGAAPAGAHALSGTWLAKSGGQVSDAGLTVTLKTQGDTITVINAGGETITARFGGPAAPVVGDPGKSMVKFVRTSASSYTSTTMRDGKVMSVNQVQVSPDGRTLTYKSENKQNGGTSQFTATKQ